MGNIADALEKAGVELVDRKYDTDDVQEPENNKEVDGQSIIEAREHEERPEEPPVVSKPIQPDQQLYESWDERIDLVANRSSHASESFRVLRSKILYPQDGSASPRTIMIASSAPEEGKSFVSINLAIAMARGVDQHALLVDCDLRRPSLAPLLGMEKVCQRGLSDYLREEADLTELIRRTSVEKLSLLGSGAIPQNPAELLSSERMERLVEELSGRYTDRFIIFDSPPFQVASESIVLTKSVDGVVIVIGSGRSDRSKIKDMVELIGRDKIIGVVFNGFREGYVTKKMFDPYSKYGSYYAKNAD